MVQPLFHVAFPHIMHWPKDFKPEIEKHNNSLSNINDSDRQRKPISTVVLMKKKNKHKAL